MRKRRGERPTPLSREGSRAKPSRSELTDEQRAAIDRIVGAFGSGGNFLLAGATGSGKTEVYLQACAAALERGLGAIVLVPEIALTPQAAGRFAARFGDGLAILHSGLTDAERRDERERIARGEARIVVGARSAIFAPVRDLGLICVDEEHDQSYKQDSDPRYDARTVAAKRAALEGAVAVYGSATPRPESWERLERLDLGGRLVGSLPPVRVVDLRREAGYPLSAPLLAGLGRVAEEGGKAILLLNRRGIAPAIHCRACGTTLRCPNCDVALVLHRDDVLHCHHCGHSDPVAGDVPGVRVARARAHRRRHARSSSRSSRRRCRSSSGSGSTRTSSRSAEPCPRRSRRFAETDRAVLLGTQMVAKGHHFAGVSLAAVVDADTQLGLPDFRAEERTFALLTQLAGRSGRDAPGRVIVQTFQPDARAVAFAARHDVAGFLAGELERRRELGYPPFCHLVRIVVAGPDPEQPLTALRELASRFQEGELLGPAPLLRLRGRYRAQLIAKTASRDASPRARPAARRGGARDAPRRAHRGRRRRPAEPLGLTGLDSSPWRTRQASCATRAISTPRLMRADGWRSLRSASTPTPRSGCGANEVEHFDDSLRQLAERMTALMADAYGVGLAATQVGVLQRCSSSSRGDDEPRVLVNPRDRQAERRAGDGRRGLPVAPAACSCRSSAASTVTIEAQDLDGDDVRLELDELPARVVQHELDHLDGVLILDRTTDDARREAMATLPRAAFARLSRLGVAATAPFGADVLERLAARHDVAWVLTRPDRPAGRGRKERAPAAKVARRAAGPGGATAGAADADDVAGVDTIVLVAYGVLIPDDLLDRRALAERAPVAAPALARRCAGRACAARGRRGDRRLDHQARQGARRRPDRGAARVPGRGRTTTRARSTTRSAELAVELLDEVLPAPAFQRAGGRADVRAQARGRGPRARPRRSGGRAAPDPRALAAHRRARGARRSTGDDLARARRGRRARPARGAARRRPPHDVRRVSARAAVIAPARRAAYSVVRRVFEDESYADRSFRTLAADLDERDRALAQRLAYGTVQRVRTLDHAIEAIGRRPVRKLDPPVLAALQARRVPARLHGQAPHAVVDEHGRARARAQASSARCRSRTPSCAALTERLRGLLGSLPEGPLKHSYPDWVHDTWRRDLGEEASLALMRAQNEPPETVVRLVRGDPPGEPTDVPGAYRVDRVDEQALAEGRVWPQSRGSQLAGLVRRRARGRADPRLVRRARREGDDARRRGDRGRAEPGTRARAARQRRAARRHERARRARPTPLRCRPS